jgi:hypothetical protein
MGQLVHVTEEAVSLHGEVLEANSPTIRVAYAHHGREV